MWHSIKKAFAVVACVAAVAAASQASAETLINGAGSTFAYPIYSKWFAAYRKVDPSVSFNYQSIGSGGGIQQIMARTIDFGASDMYLSDAALSKAPAKLIHIPTVMGAVVLTYNVPGVGTGLRLTPDVIADIYLGRITRWNDPRIAASNRGVRLPAAAIIVAHRSEGSGTTSIFTSYLCSVSPQWKQQVGTGTSVRWPIGLGGKGSEGVAGIIRNTPYSIGYAEIAYAIGNHLPVAAVKNKAGYFITPNIKTTTAAAAGAAKHMPADFRLNIVNQPGKNAYPIAGFTWILLYQHINNHEKGQKIVQFLNWAYRHGEGMATQLLYAPLPPNVTKMVLKTIRTITY